MKSLLVLMSATAALASHTTTYTPYYLSQHSFPITSLIFTIIFGLLVLLHIFWIIKVAKAKQNLNSSDLEKQSLVNSTLPEGVVASNILVSPNNRSNLLAELRHDEQLVWANENLAPLRAPILIFMSMSLLFAAVGFATAVCFTIVFDSNVDSVFLSMWMPFLSVNVMFLFLAFVMQKRAANSVIYALTSKRVFILSSMPAVCWGGKTETVRAYDLDGIHQTTVTRKEDGSGTLTFSAAALVDGAAYNGRHHHYGLFAFANIPNVTAVKDLIEQHKTLRKKQAANQ